MEFLTASNRKGLEDKVKDFDNGNLNAENKDVVVIGGGDTASAVKQSGINKGFTHISTGGGASLLLLSGKELPAFESLKEYV